MQLILFFQLYWLLLSSVGGVRHLLWDRLPETLLTNDGVEKSSVLLVALAGAVSLGAAAL